MYYKVGQVLLQNAVAFLYYKPRQVVLQSRAGIKKKNKTILQKRALKSDWWQKNCPQKFLKLNFYYNNIEEKITPPPQTHLRHL